MAQSGSASALGAEGRWFESSFSDKVNLNDKQHMKHFKKFLKTWKELYIPENEDFASSVIFAFTQAIGLMGCAILSLIILKTLNVFSWILEIILTLIVFTLVNYSTFLTFEREDKCQKSKTQTPQ